MRVRMLAIGLCALLLACGGPAPTATPNAPATQTRAIEVAQIATLAAPTATPTATVTTAPTNTPAPTATPLPTATATQPPTLPTRNPPVIAPTRTPVPTVSAPPAPVAQTWKNLPVPPNATIMQQPSPDVVIFYVPDNELSVSAFMKREWEKAGLVFYTTSPQSNAVFYVYSYPSDPKHLVSYAVTRLTSDTAQLGVIDTGP